MGNRIVIVGGGPAGLAAGWRLAEAGRQVVILEARSQVGGLCATVRRGDTVYDLGPHRLYTELPELHTLLNDLLGEDIVEAPRYSQLYWRGRRWNYPLRARELRRGLGVIPFLTIGLELVGTLFRFGHHHGNYRQAVVARFGRTMSERLILPMTQRTWGLLGEEISARLADVRLPRFSGVTRLWELVRGHYGLSSIRYPRGGFGRVCTELAERLRAAGGRVLTGARAVQFALDGSIAEVQYLAENQIHTLECDAVVSTMSIADLASRLPDLDAPFDRLSFRSLAILYLRLSKPQVSTYATIYYCGDHYPFQRLFEMKHFDRGSAPSGETIIGLEFACDRGDTVWSSQEVLRKQAISILAMDGILRQAEVLDAWWEHLPDVYPQYPVGYETALEGSLAALGSVPNLYSTGRAGLYNYANLDQAIYMGLSVADHILAGEPSASWYTHSKEFSRFRIVD